MYFKIRSLPATWDYATGRNPIHGRFCEEIMGKAAGEPLKAYYHGFRYSFFRTITVFFNPLKSYNPEDNTITEIFIT